MKKIIVSSVLLGALMSTSSVFAEETAVPTLYAAPVAVSAVTTTAVNADVVVPVTPEVTSVYPVLEKVETLKVVSIDKMKARGAQLLKERINSLNVNAEAIAKSKALTAEQKSAFAGFFTGKILELNTLGGKIASSTDATSTKALVSSIFTDHRIYGVLIPQIRLEKRLYELQAHSVKLNDTFVKVQARITEFKNKGKDVTVWQKNLDDAKVLVATDTTKIQNLLVQINALQPSSYGTTSKSVIESVNKGTKAIANDFQSINRKVMRPSYLMNMKGWKKNAEVHASTTASTTVR
jgi:hypothetical protein